LFEKVMRNDNNTRGSLQQAVVDSLQQLAKYVNVRAYRRRP
jgi:hypothetical protein